jgi:hypothetical protein
MRRTALNRPSPIQGTSEASTPRSDRLLGSAPAPTPSSFTLMVTDEQAEMLKQLVLQLVHLQTMQRSPDDTVH